MAKKFLERLIDEDFKEASVNFTIAWGLGNLASVLSNAFLRFNLNEYNSVDHFAIGVGLGTYAYRKAGKGAKGILAGLIAATLFNGCWEYAEGKGNIYGTKWDAFDTALDVACVYAGSIVGFLGEKLKRDISKRENEKWVI